MFGFKLDSFYASTRLTSVLHELAALLMFFDFVPQDFLVTKLINAIHLSKLTLFF